MSGEDFDDELLALAGGDDDADVEEGEAYVFTFALVHFINLHSSQFQSLNTS